MAHLLGLRAATAAGAHLSTYRGAWRKCFLYLAGHHSWRALDLSWSTPRLDVAQLIRHVRSNRCVPLEAQKAFGLFAEDLEDVPLSFWARLITAWAVQTHVHSHEVLQKDIERHPVRSSTLRPPIFIVGLPRTGTTLLHHLLALDPDSQCLRAYELMRYFARGKRVWAPLTPCSDAMGKDEPKRGKQLTSFLEELKAKHVTASDLSANERQVHVQVPPVKLKRVIDLLANYVAQMGEPFEEALRQRLAKSDGDRGIDWSFLKEHSSPEAQYYRWRTFSFVQGDTRHHWRMEPFQMCTKGMVWHPPQRNRGGSDSDSSSSSRSRSRLSPGYRRQEDDFCAKWQLDRPARLLLRELPPEMREQAMMKFNPYTEVKHADYSKVFAAWTRRFRNSKEEEHHGAPEANGRKRMGTERLRRRDVRDLERLLKDLSVNACDIRRAMVWCLDNDDMAIDVSRHLLDGLEEEDITAHERCLRLCLVSDILHNAASIYKPGAVVYRREFETHLPKTFEDFHRLFRGVKDLSLVHRILASWTERVTWPTRSMWMARIFWLC
eukprot:s1745_g6.t1